MPKILGQLRTGLFGYVKSVHGTLCPTQQGYWKPYTTSRGSGGQVHFTSNGGKPVDVREKLLIPMKNTL